MNTYEITEKTVKTIIEFVKERYAYGAAASGELNITGINSIEFASWHNSKKTIQSM